MLYLRYFQGDVETICRWTVGRKPSTKSQLLYLNFKDVKVSCPDVVINVYVVYGKGNYVFYDDICHNTTEVKYLFADEYSVEFIANEKYSKRDFGFYASFHDGPIAVQKNTGDLEWYWYLAIAGIVVVNIVLVYLAVKDARIKRRACFAQCPLPREDQPQMEQTPNVTNSPVISVQNNNIYSNNAYISDDNMYTAGIPIVSPPVDFNTPPPRYEDVVKTSIN